MKVGLNVRWDDISASTTQSHVYVDFYAQSDAWGFNDSQTIVFSGSLGGSWNYTMVSASGATVTKFLGTYDIGTQATSYSGGPSWTFAATLTGVYAGTGPSISYGFTLPARPASVPSTPSAPTVSSIASTTATVSWSAPSSNGASIDYYQVQVDDSSSFSSPNISATDSASPYAASGLTRATTYYARIRAHNSVGWGAYSSARSFVTSATVPGAPTGLAVSSITATTGSVAWTAPSDTGGASITSYTIQVDDSSGFGTPIISTSDTASPYAMAGLAHTTTYYIRIRANNSVGSGSWSSTASFATTATVPGQPTGLTVTGVTDTGANLAWTAPADNGGAAISLYQIQVDETSAFSTPLVDTTDTASPYAITGLSAATTYYVRIRATNSLGYGAWSTTTSFGSITVVPDAPTNLAAANQLQSTATLSWLAPSYDGGASITGFTLQVATDLAFTSIVINTPLAGTTFDCTALSAHTNYYYRVLATNSVGNSAWSTAGTFATKPSAYVNVGGSWLPAKAYVNVAGTWKEAITWRNVGGSWYQ